MSYMLDSTQKIQMVNGAASKLDVAVSWVNYSGSATTPGCTLTSVNTATTTDILAAPASGETRKVTQITIRHVGATQQKVTVLIDASGTDYELFETTLQPDEVMTWTESSGWDVFDSNGRRYVQAVLPGGLSSVLVPPCFATANLTSTKTLTSASCFAVYVGKAPRALTSAQIRYRVTTAAATITWAEVAIAKGAINVGGNPTLTVVGFADVSAVINSTGQKTTTVNVSAGQSIAAGDDLWVVIGNSATTAGVVRAISIADDIQVGVQASAAQRPSLIVGTGTAFTIEGATTLAPWAALVA